MLVVRRNESVQVSRGRKRVGVVRDVASGAPATGWVTCDTQTCRDYIAQVNNLSKALTERWEVESLAIQNEQSSIPTKQQQIRFLDDYKTWVYAHRTPFLESYAKLREDCDSTFAGPCKEAIEVARKHEDQVIKWSEKYETYTKRDSGIEPIEQGKNPPKGNGGSGGGNAPLFNFSFGGLMPVLLVGGALFLATRK